MSHEKGIEAAELAYWDTSADPEGERDMVKAIKAYLDASGMVMVPRIPTNEMLGAWTSADTDMQIDRGKGISLSGGYAVMISAAPNPFQTVEGSREKK